MKSVYYRLMHWETWNYLVKYLPILPVWLWYCIRARSLWFFTSSNPTIIFGGFEGETKKEIYEQLPPGSYPESIYISPSFTIDEIQSLIKERKFEFPFIVKPDAGMMGLMFRRIDNSVELADYHHIMPVDYIIQKLIDFPVEVSIFYYRFPNQVKGTITGFVKKEFLQIYGDGESTILELMLKYDRVRFRMEEMKSKHADHLEQILPKDKPYVLSYALNLSRGGRLVSLEHEKDTQLLDVLDKLNNYSRYFYYGRYDIKCASIESLKQGVNFSVLEFNGCGAEPHHAYGNGYTIWQAYGIFIHHWKILFQISQYNHKHGYPHWTFKKGWIYLKKAKANFRVLKTLDRETAFQND